MVRRNLYKSYTKLGALVLGLAILTGCPGKPNSPTSSDGKQKPSATIAAPDGQENGGNAGGYNGPDLVSTAIPEDYEDDVAIEKLIGEPDLACSITGNDELGLSSLTASLNWQLSGLVLPSIPTHPTAEQERDFGRRFKINPEAAGFDHLTLFGAFKPQIEFINPEVRNDVFPRLLIQVKDHTPEIASFLWTQHGFPMLTNISHPTQIPVFDELGQPVRSEDGFKEHWVRGVQVALPPEFGAHVRLVNAALKSPSLLEVNLEEFVDCLMGEVQRRAIENARLRVP